MIIGLPYKCTFISSGSTGTICSISLVFLFYICHIKLYLIFSYPAFDIWFDLKYIFSLMYPYLFLIKFASAPDAMSPTELFDISMVSIVLFKIRPVNIWEAKVDPMLQFRNIKVYRFLRSGNILPNSTDAYRPKILSWTSNFCKVWQ